MTDGINQGFVVTGNDDRHAGAVSWSGLEIGGSVGVSLVWCDRLREAGHWARVAARFDLACRVLACSAVLACLLSWLAVLSVVLFGCDRMVGWFAVSVVVALAALAGSRRCAVERSAALEFLDCELAGRGVWPVAREVL